MYNSISYVFFCRSVFQFHSPIQSRSPSLEKSYLDSPISTTAPHRTKQFTPSPLATTSEPPSPLRPPFRRSPSPLRQDPRSRTPPKSTLEQSLNIPEEGVKQRSGSLSPREAPGTRSPRESSMSGPRSPRDVPMSGTLSPREPQSPLLQRLMPTIREHAQSHPTPSSGEGGDEEEERTSKVQG